MSPRRESPLRTLAVAAGVAVICSLIVATAALVLRPYELAYSALERNRGVLIALGELAQGDQSEAGAVVERFVELDRRVVDLQTGRFSDAVDNLTFDFRETLQVTDQLVEIPGSFDVAELGARPGLMPVYLQIDSATGQLSHLVLPIYASGMWSTIYGYVALESDFATIAGIAFYEHGETPGIGDRILDPAWLATWQGRQIYDSGGRVAFRITSNAQAAEPRYRVDSITGATVTVDAVSRAMQYWFSEHGYGPFLRRLAEESL